MTYDGRSIQDRFDSRVARLARRQHGVISRIQALELGATEGRIRHRLNSGRWERVGEGVYRLAGTTPTWRQTLLIAALAWGPGAYASHASSAAMWEIRGFDAGVVELTVPRNRRRRHPAVVHRQILPSVDVTMRDSIPLTTPARTLLDLAGSVPPGVLEVALDDALRRRLASIPRLRWRLRETGGRGRGGSAVLARLVAARVATSVPESVLETRLLALLRGAGLDPAVQHEIRSGGRFVGRVDLAFPREKVAVEADGYTWHSGRITWQKDLTRRNAITAAGWKVINVTWQDVHERPEETHAAILGALRSSTDGADRRARRSEITRDHLVHGARHAVPAWNRGTS